MTVNGLAKREVLFGFFLRCSVTAEYYKTPVLSNVDAKHIASEAYHDDIIRGAGD